MHVGVAGRLYLDDDLVLADGGHFVIGIDVVGGGVDLQLDMVAVGALGVGGPGAFLEDHVIDFGKPLGCQQGAHIDFRHARGCLG